MIKENPTFSVQSLTKMAICVALLCVSAYISFPIPFASAMITALTIVMNLAAFLLTPQQTLVVMGKCVTFWYVLAAGVLFLLWWLIALFTALPIIPSPVLVLENLTDIFVKYIAVHGG